MYFPKCSNEIVEDFEKVPESIRLLLEKIIDSKGQIKKLKHDPYHKKIVSDILSVVGECNQPNTPIDVMIEQMTKLLENVIGRNDKTLTDLKGDIIKRPLMTDRDDYYTYRSDNILTDLEYDSVWPVKFTKHLIKKNEERQNLSTTYEVPEDPDDVVCQVCNDGDYEDYDLIVYCSSCTLTVHQSCYGIVTIPEGDWLCNVCNLSDTERVECVLCPVKGGAMKPCSLRKTSNLYTTIMNLRKESSHLVRFELQQNHKKTIENNLSESLSNNSESSKTNKQTAKTSPNKIKSNPSIDLNNKNKINGLNEIINKENAWVHLSCALWIPEVIINDFASKEEIRNFDAIGKKRFQEKCTICLLQNYGPTVKCEKCDLRFHVECARINKYQLEMTNNMMGELKYHIYCQTHRPHKLIKNIELRKQREIDDITQLANTLEKNYDALRKSDSALVLTVFKQNKWKKNKANETKKKREFSLKEKKKILKFVKEIIIEASNLTITFEKKTESEDMTTYLFKKEEEKSISEYKIDYYLTLNPRLFPWYLVKETEFKNVSVIDIFNEYREMIPSEVEFYRQVLKMKKLPQVQVQAQENPLDMTKYCYCKREANDQMVGCEGETCINNGWIHNECDEELRSLSQDIIQSEEFKFYCRDCLANIKIA